MFENGVGIVIIKVLSLENTHCKCFTDLSIAVLKAFD